MRRRRKERLKVLRVIKHKDNLYVSWGSWLASVSMPKEIHDEVRVWMLEGNQEAQGLYYDIKGKTIVRAEIIRAFNARLGRMRNQPKVCMFISLAVGAMLDRNEEKFYEYTEQCMKLGVRVSVPRFYWTKDPESIPGTNHSMIEE